MGNFQTKAVQNPIIARKTGGNKTWVHGIDGYLRSIQAASELVGVKYIRQLGLGVCPPSKIISPGFQIIEIDLPP